ncbi:NAD-dependent epimerase/dehydratase family protein [Cohnella terricola]|uniref:NAD(P)-dependent oxidoreductase n=1 Tax=Cohnella terricola TaxID=1289167 RepID=A0A559JMS3_9BACL|nr:NAD(P)-dependent oxidoreductase [Cohnella terricola]TVY01181.1 NAD(P)-dependent oxidoreductase [Cohnella terricola]
MNKIALTGGSGKLGTWVAEQLQRRGYEVTSLDTRRSDRLKCRQLQVDLSDLGQVTGALRGSDAVVHLAAIPAPLGYSFDRIFANNTISTYNVLEAASLLDIGKVVTGSSESAYGFAWAPAPSSPLYFPLDENHPLLPQECYGLSKSVCEQTAAMFSRRSGLQAIALRYSMIVAPSEYERHAIGKPQQYKHILWSYVDIRDAVSATLAALESDSGEFRALNVTSDDTFSDIPSESLLDRFYPDVEDRRKTFAGREAIVSNGLAKSLLGWAPVHSWKQVIN